ncbi:FAST kinase domain-containing protein 1, mitochondrial isoform X2 [Petaurus breviceps papuanus]|uniref:FAST kinase domain-containing protein 1, mitochondrial isoform X2 n=1 Tax=Petaurus breviceps papuanus TaxID=3040969 RepID=UPI0036D8F591
MLRLRAAYEFFWRVFQHGTKTIDPLLNQINKCVNEEQIFDIVGKNTARLSEKHVGCACKVLWQFQKEKDDLMRNIPYVRDHPQFLALRILAKDKMELMDDNTLVNILYIMLRFTVEAHDSLVEHLVMEAWRRAERFDLKVLSKFSSCLGDQHMFLSPLMGKIADILNRNLDSVQDLRTLSVLMVNIGSVISQNFCERLVNKAELLSDTMDHSQFNTSIRILRFLQNTRYNYYPLLEKCNCVFISNIAHLNLDTLSFILSLYKSLQFSNFPFQVLAREKLSKMTAVYCDPASFVKLFVALGPLARPTEEKWLMSALKMMVDELTSQQALAIVVTMEEMNSKDSYLIEKIASVLHKYLHVYKPVELTKITTALIHLHLHNSEFIKTLRKLLLSHLRNNVIPSEISMLVRVIAMLPFPHLDESGLSRVESILPQCRLSDLSTFALSLSTWIRHDHSYLDNVCQKNIKLLPQLNAYGYQRLQQANNLNVLWEELKYVNGEWFEEELLEETVVTLQRLSDQITHTNIANFSAFIVKTNYLSAPVLDKIASVTVQQINKIHPLAIHSVLLPFSILNYDPPQKDEFFGACIQRLNSQLINDSISAVQYQIYKMLGEILGGPNYVKPSALTPYGYIVDFEYILDKKKKPLSHRNQGVVLNELPNVPWRPDTHDTRSGLPPGAQRVALEFLDSQAFCKNILHLKGKSAMKKRHLEILGYHVIQIPYLAWNSMELSTKDAWMEYLREHMFAEVKS